MQEQIVSFDTAKLAKEKGFDWPTVCWYNEEGNLQNITWVRDPIVVDDYYLSNECFNHNRSEQDFDFSNKQVSLNTLNTNVCSAPTQSLLQKWLREKSLNIDVVAFCAFGAKFYNSTVLVAQACSFDILEDNMGYDTYEEALEAGLLSALKQLN